MFFSYLLSNRFDDGIVNRSLILSAFSFLCPFSHSQMCPAAQMVRSNPKGCGLSGNKVSFFALTSVGRAPKD